MNIPRPCTRNYLVRLLPRIRFGLARESLGHALLNTWLYFETNNPKFQITFIFYDRNKLASIEAFMFLIRNLKKQYNIITLPLPEFYLLYRILNSRYFPFFRDFLEDIYHIHHHQDYERYGSKIRCHLPGVGFPDFKLTYKEEKNFLASFEKLSHSLGLVSRYVCVYIRTGGYYGDYDDIRNVDPLSVVKALRIIRQNGMQIVLMGRSFEYHNLNLDVDFIAYAFSPIASPENDLVLIQHSEFVLSNNSGFTMLPWLLGIPTLVHNHAPVGSRPILSDKCVYIRKSYKRDGFIVRYNEIEDAVKLVETKCTLQKYSYCIEDNTEDDIAEMVQNYIISGSDSGVFCNFDFEIYGGDVKVSKFWLKKHSHLFRVS